MSQQVNEPIFPPEEVNDIQTILLLRIYDATMSQLILDHPTEGHKLYELHKNGGLILEPSIVLDETKVGGND